MTTAAKPKGGLEDTVATSSAICYLDGDRGVLSYCGYDIHDLARHATFEEVCYLLWHRRLPTRGELGDLQAQLVASRPLPEPVLRLMRALPPGDGMDTLRTLTSALSHYDADTADHSVQANYRKAVRLTAQIGSIVATIGRMNSGGGPMQPDPVLGHAANFLYMLTGEKPSEHHAKVFDVALVLHADHEFNASTFAARVVAGTLATMYAGVAAAIAALSGPLHGGANTAVMRTLLEIGEVDNVDSYIKKALSEKRKIMGFGHAVYRTEDPRATHLRKFSKEMGELAGDTKWYEISRKVEEVMQREKGLYPNVDFFSASTYYMMGIPLDLYTPIFAVSRISGWTGHILEQYADNKLIRPRAEYVGKRDVPYVPIDQR